jgi:mannose-6-phosphate isomerase-like protein (cupin superfamily)
MLATAISPVFPTQRLHVVWCTDADVAALAPLLGREPIPREQPGHPSCRYLDRRIRKVWGGEERVYDDALSEARLLEIGPLKRTSMHAHLRKSTTLVCEHGSGYLRTLGGTEIALEPGSAVVIMPGALHCSSSQTGMRLVEFESPKDKFDLVRFEDPTRAVGMGYEREDEAEAAGEESEPLVAVEGGPPMARLRRSGAGGAVRFGLRTGAQLKTDPGTLRAAVAVQMTTVLRREFDVLGPDSVAAAADDDTYLTIEQPGSPSPNVGVAAAERRP